MIRLIEKLQRILAMTTSPNAHEAAVAAAKAAELMAAYNLNYSDLNEVRDGGGKQVRAFFLDKEKREDWRAALASKVAQYSFCEYLAWNKRVNMQHVFVGESHNIAGAIVLYEYLRDTCLRVWDRDEAMDDVISRGEFNSFASGFTTRVMQRLDERMKESELFSGTENALVIYGGLRRIKSEQNAAFIAANFGGGGGMLSVRGDNDDLDAFQAGITAGDKVGLDRQIHEKKSGLLR